MFMGKLEYPTIVFYLVGSSFTENGSLRLTVFLLFSAVP